MTDNEDKTTSKDSSATQDPSRRKFIKNSGIAAGGVVGGALLGGYFGNQFDTEETSETKQDTVDFSETRQFFQREEDFDVLSNAVERIYPKDDNGPGAIELGVPYFIDKQLAGRWGSNERMYMKKPFQADEIPLNNGSVFLQGIRKIEEVSQEKHDEQFVNLDEDKQNDILESFEKETVEMKNGNSAIFFEKLIQSTLEGAFSDPLYGGNKNMKGWAMKEYPGPRFSLKNKLEKGFEAFEGMERKSLKTHM